MKLRRVYHCLTHFGMETKSDLLDAGLKHNRLTDASVQSVGGGATSLERYYYLMHNRSNNRNIYKQRIFIFSQQK